MNCRHCQKTYGNGGGHCTGCHESFNSGTAFDKHRHQDGDTRRCLTGDEMTGKGMATNGRGWWVASLWDDRR